MRRIVVVLGVAVLMAATVVLTAGTALAQAETATFNEWIPISEELENNCTEELDLIRLGRHVSVTQRPRLPV
jgi:hypothetical protein